MGRIGVLSAAAMIGAAMGGMGGGAQVIEREFPPLELEPELERVRPRGKGRRSNEAKPGRRGAKKKAKRKAARASRRANLRRS